MEIKLKQTNLIDYVNHLVELRSLIFLRFTSFSKKVFLLFLMFYAINSYSQKYVLDWHKTIGGNLDDNGITAIATDDSNNVIIGGYFTYQESDSIDFDPRPDTNFYLVRESGDLFLAKYDTLGNLVWAVNWASQNGVSPCGYLGSIQFSDNGNILVSSGTGGVNTYHSIYTFSSTGNLLNDFNIMIDDGTGFDAKQYLDMKIYNNSYYLFGSFVGDVNFDPAGNDTILHGSEDGLKAYLANYGMDGILNWITSIYSVNDAFYWPEMKTALDDAGNVYIAGVFSDGPIAFKTQDGFDTLFVDIDSTGNYTPTSAFIAKFDINGNYLWANQFIYDSLDSINKIHPYDWVVHDLTVDNEGNPIITGVSGGGNYYIYPEGYHVTTTKNPYNSFIAKFNSSGDVVFSYSIGGDNLEYGYNIHTDKDNNIYHILDFTSDDGVLHPQSSETYSENDGNTMLAIYSAIGDLLDVHQFKESTPTEVSFDKNMNFYGTGYEHVQFHGNDIFLNRYKLYVPVIIEEEEEICEGDSIYLEGEYQTMPGVYTDTLNVTEGLDTLLVTTLIVHSADTTKLVDTICGNENYMGYSETGNYIVIETNKNGCDSVILLDLTVLKIDTTEVLSTICKGYSLFGYSESGEYEVILTSTTGCDSIILLDLTVLEDTFYLEKFIPQGQAFMGFNKSGCYTLEYTSSLGCDSIVNLFLGIVPFDTIPVQVFDTTSIPYMDTIVHTINDTIWTEISDTSYIELTDSNIITIYDTIVTQIYDTIFVEDTNYITLKDSVEFIISDSSTFISEFESGEVEISIYPNPSSTYINVELSQPVLSRIEVYDLNGNLLETITPDNSTAEMYLSGFESGNYLLRIISIDESFVAKEFTIIR